MTQSIDSIIEMLRSADIFGGLEEATYRELAGITERRQYSAGDFVFVEHTEGDDMFIIEEGDVSIELALASENEAMPLVLLGPGQVFGEMAVIDSQARSATAQAATNCTLLALRKGDLDDYMDEHPAQGYRIMRNLAQIMASRIRHTNQKILDNITWGMI